MTQPAAMQELKVQIGAIAEARAKEIRHADVITHDPEGQRVKAVIIAALWDLYEYLNPADDGKTVVVSERNTPFVVHGMTESQSASQSVPAEPVYFAGVCGICGAIHDPRGTYDHAATPPQKTARRIRPR